MRAHLANDPDQSHANVLKFMQFHRLVKYYHHHACNIFHEMKTKTT